MIILRSGKFRLIELLAVVLDGNSVRTSTPQFLIDLAWRTAQKFADLPHAQHAAMHRQDHAALLIDGVLVSSAHRKILFPWVGVALDVSV
jgi:hypothetical protein